ncbi:MAG: DNA topoisomerase (ATP-hydrolyzing) subunit B [Planctomycetota bacterium]|nr:MAG: DNA topoisomerase (ATP-hydrolyzing) subunit B [Planctomycetota bacterium]
MGTATTQTDYDADSIQILEGMEAVRKRPAMYIGDTSRTGLHHLVFEVVDNSIDEALAGRCDTIEVVLGEDGSCTVADNGAGIPVKTHPSAGVSTLEVVMTTLHAGGKFEREGDAAYKVSGGLHGVGVSCVNALSEWLEAEVYRDGFVWAQRYERGVAVTPLEKRGKTTHHGTRIAFKPDPEIFETVEFDFDYLANRLRQLAFLNKGVTIRITDERTSPPREERFHYAGGIVAFVRYLGEGKQVLHPEPIYLSGRDEATRTEMEVAFQYNDGFREQLFSFVNNIHTINGGTHVSGFRSALTRQFNRFAQEILRGKDRERLPSGEDYREGLTCVLSVKVPEPQFEGQTKGKLGNREVAGVVESLVNAQLATWIEEHPAEAKVIVQKASHAARVREAMRKARDLARRKGALSSGGLPGKLWDCSSRKVEETEIFIVEGDSAGGSAKAGRDRRFQAILPIKGKILNVEKASLDKLLGHDEIKTIIAALGTGFHDDFDAEKLRYGKIIIMTDADVDGSHIRTLLLTFFYRHMQPLIESGRIFVAQPPLYRIKRRKRQMYVLDDAELRERLLEFGADGCVLEVLATGERIEGEPLRELLVLLAELEEHARYVQKKGVDFERYLEARRPDGSLPMYRIRTRDDERFLLDDEQLADYLATLGEDALLLEPGDSPPADGSPYYWKTEFLNKREIEVTLNHLAQRGLPIEHYFRDEERGPAYRLHDGKHEHEVHTLMEIVRRVREIGQEGLEVQRYKGLGEMNPEQLWETTMDPERRSLIRIRHVDAARADNMFSVLMGSEVAVRRRFIERHALDVKDLDI